MDFIKFLSICFVFIVGCRSAGSTHRLVEIMAPQGSTVAINGIVIEKDMTPRVNAKYTEQLFRLRCGEKYQIDVYHNGGKIHHKDNFIVPEMNSFIFQYELD